MTTVWVLVESPYNPSIVGVFATKRAAERMADRLRQYNNSAGYYAIAEYDLEQ